MAPSVWATIYGNPPTTPILQNTDGDEFELMTIRYSLREGTISRAREALKGISRISFESDTKFVWVEQRPKQPINPVLIASGTFTDSGLIEVNVNSRQRHELVGRAIEEALGDVISSTDVEPLPLDLSKSSPPPASREDEEIPQEVQREIRNEFYTKFYKTWPDEPLPALNGMRPRDAVKDPGMRGKVISLLKGLESSHASRGDDFDFGWLWKYMGLRRP